MATVSNAPNTAKKKRPTMRAMPTKRTPPKKQQSMPPKIAPGTITPIDLNSQAWADDCAAYAWLDSCD